MYSALVIRYTVSNSSHRLRFIRAMENSASKSVTARSPRTACRMPRARA